MKYRKINYCWAFMSAVEMGDIELDDGYYYFPLGHREICYCPFCGEKLEPYTTVQDVQNKSEEK